MTYGQNPNQNHLLAALFDNEYDRLAPHLELVSMCTGDILYEVGGKLLYVYFPTTSIISLHNLMENGDSSEVAGIGNEGMLGTVLFMGGQTMPSRAVVQIGGYGYRLKAEILMEEFNRMGPTLRLLLRYTQALITQTSQTAVCNRHHSIEQQFCRWLLLAADRLTPGELKITHELIAHLLGVRREGVTEAAGHLRRLGYIRYRRGHMTILDRRGLESEVCECYGVVKKEFSRLLNDNLHRQNHHLSLPLPMLSIQRNQRVAWRASN
ncbi:Crp/Fnr family transcriptional regulator [Undibacterium sp. SXout7W]|uniref:Crp/Fnr family transcriptional regulator n=1 Tax=Undibacterium sp. SXout7W TaxID=3413049 RepID=UPI003BF357D2